MNLKRTRLTLFEADERARRLQRQAVSGDPQAADRYRREVQRKGTSDEHLGEFERNWRRENTKQNRDAYKRELKAFGREVPRELQHAHVPKVNRDNAPSFDYGHVFHHHTRTNSDGSPLRVRVNGRIKLWKTRPDEFRIPVKYGHRGGDVNEITHRNAHEWMVDHPEEHPDES